MASKIKRPNTKLALQKTPTGITGLDELTGGGLPTGRPTLICGSAGAGKTLFAIEFVFRGVIDFKEPGVIMTFEENVVDLEKKRCLPRL